jgi:hypothetical protein
MRERAIAELKVGDVIRSDYNGENMQILAIASDTAAHPANVQHGEPPPLWFDLADTRAIADCVVANAMAV